MYARIPRRALMRAVMVVMAMAVLASGCGDGTNVAGGDPPAAPVPDMVEETSRSRSELFDPWNPYTVDTVDRLLVRRDVSSAVAALERRGMERSSVDQIVIEGSFDNESVRATFIGLSWPDGREEIGVVACFEQSGELLIVPGILSAQPGRSGVTGRELAPNVWTQDLPAGGAEWWRPDQWDEFWLCMLIHAPGPTTSCMVGCYFAGPGYLHCALACAVTQTAATVVRCALNIALQGRESSREMSVE